MDWLHPSRVAAVTWEGGRRRVGWDPGSLTRCGVFVFLIGLNVTPKMQIVTVRGVSIYGL